MRFTNGRYGFELACDTPKFVEKFGVTNGLLSDKSFFANGSCFDRGRRRRARRRRVYIRRCLCIHRGGFTGRCGFTGRGGFLQRGGLAGRGWGPCRPWRARRFFAHARGRRRARRRRTRARAQDASEHEGSDTRASFLRLRPCGHEEGASVDLTGASAFPLQVPLSESVSSRESSRRQVWQLLRAASSRLRGRASRGVRSGSVGARPRAGSRR